MSVYKEGFHAVSLIENSSIRIFNDACDFGAPTKKGDEIWNWTTQLVDWYGDKNTRKVEKYSTGTTVTNEVTLMDEWTTGEKFTFRVTYTTLPKNHKMDGYVYIERIK